MLRALSKLLARASLAVLKLDIRYQLALANRKVLLRQAQLTENARRTPIR
jgi:hypothetical protein